MSKIKNEVSSNLYLQDGVVKGTLSVDGFIVPNALLNLASEFNKRTAEYVNAISATSEKPTSEYGVQVWCVSENSDNVGDHGFGVDGKWIRPRINVLPANLFFDKKEGDNIEFRYRDDESELTIIMRLNQADYRYARFGKFEDVFEQLHSQAKAKAQAC